MIKTIKNSILFSALLFVFCAGNIYAHPAWGIVVDSKNKCILPTLKASGKLTGKKKSER
jgi:hypothetical protein